MLTGSKLTFFIDGQFVCSALVACALERAGNIFDRNSANIAPADLAKYFHVERFVAREPQADAVAGARSTARTSSARERMPSLR